MIKSASGFILLFILRSTMCIPLDQFYPFGNATVSRGDDNSSPPISLQKEFLFFNQSHSELYVNTNGAISFQTAVRQFTPNPFPLSGNLMIIAAFWGDVDTRGTGTVWYQESTDNALLNRASMDIRDAFPTQAAEGFTATGLFIATWDRVGYFDSHTDLTNTFQCVLVTDESQSFVMFLYADGLIQWTTGDSSNGVNGMGGTQAQVGFNAGDGINFAAVPESRTADIINIADIPGILAFQVDGENISESSVPLPPPRNLTVSIPGVPRESNTLIINWGRPLRDQGTLSGYELCYVESSVGDCDSNGVTVNITDPDQLSLNITDLSINTNYIVVVRARTEDEIGAPARANGTTDEDAPDPVMNIVSQFSPNNTIRGIYTITWTPPAPTNGSFYQRLEYSYSSAYNVGPTYNGSFSTGYLELDQSQNQFIFDALYYTDYNFTITTINLKYNITNGPSHSSNQSSPTVPTPVRNIKVAMSTLESIFVTWDHPEYPNSQLLNYIFYYNDDPSMLQSSGGISTDGFVDMILETVTSYNLTGLPPFTNYTILITVAGRDVGNAPFVMESLQSTNATVPLAPENLTVNIPGVPRESTTLIVNWERPLSDRGVLLGYELCYVESLVEDCDINGVTVNITDPDQLSYTINDLSINTNYIVEVRGRTEAGLGDPASANGTTDEDAPDPVMNIVTQFSPNNTIRGIYTITWTPPAPTNGSFYQRLEYSYSSAYNVGPTYNGSFSSGYLELDQSQNQFIFDALYYTDYNFTITAINLKYNITNGPSHSSNQSSPTVPTPVRNIKVAMSTLESIFVTWDHPEYPNSQLLNYIFYYNDNPSMLQLSGGISTDGFVDTILETVTSYNLTGLPPFTNHTILITVTGRDVGNSPFVMESLQRTNATIPFPPENLTASIPGVPHSSTSLIVRWEKPQYNQGALSGYKLCYVESSIGNCDAKGVTVDITGPDQLSYTINDLSINTNYIVEVRGRTEAGLGDPASANGTTDEDAPDPVMNIVTQFSPNNTIRGIYTITWTPPAPANGSFYQRLEYSYSSAYNVGPIYNGSFSTGYLELDQSQNQFIFDALYYTDYNFTITTINLKYNITNGPSHSSNQSSPTVPTAVRNIKVAMSTPESIFVTWDHPEYPNSQLLNYIFYYNDNPSRLQSSSGISTDGFVDMILETVTSYNLTGLPPFTNYTILITVAGRDVGNAPFAMELLQRTNTTVPINPPTPPSNIQIPPPSFGTISLTLPQPDEIDTGELYLYAVVVVTGNELGNNPIDIINSNGGSLPPPYPGKNNIYTATVYTRSEDVPTIFMVGDNSRTTGPNGRVYFNRRLNENTMYGVFKYIRLESDTGVVEEGPLIVCSEYITVDSTTASQEDDDDDNDIGLIVGVSIASALVLLIVLIGIIIIAYYHWQHHDKKEHYDEEVAYAKSDNLVLDNVYVPPQQYQVEFEETSTSNANEVAVNPHVDDPQDFPDNDGHKETE